MSVSMLIKKNIKKHIGTLLCITLLLVLIFFSCIMAITVYQNAGNYISKEMERVGYGDLTAWVSNVNNIDNFVSEIEDISDVEKVESQEVIYAGYTVNGTHSDNEGQLLNFNECRKYKIFNNDLNEYTQIDNMNLDEIYVSPSIISSYDAKIGDKITFEFSRTGEKKEFIIAGFFEDPFMGSSMIDMKSFLISNQNFENIKSELSAMSSIDVLARTGAMLHIFQNDSSTLSTQEFNVELNTHSNLPNHTEFIYTNDTIYGFMMILQNIFIGFLISFVIVLLIVSIIVINNSISNTIDNDQKDLGILKTIGFTSKKLQLTQIVQYGITIIFAIVISILGTNFLLGKIANVMITSTGFIMPTNIPIISCILGFVIISIIILVVIIQKTNKISKIKPIEAINGDNTNYYNKKVIENINKEDVEIDIAIRQLTTGKKRYIGTFIIATLLIIFVLIVGRLDSWLGKNGEGLMNAFSVADHDVGVQPLVHIDMNDVQDIIRKYADIESVHSLAMQEVSVNGVDYTANIIDNSELFHILQGRTTKADNEIVITETVASELNIKIGDKVTINNERNYREYEVVRNISMCK